MRDRAYGVGECKRLTAWHLQVFETRGQQARLAKVWDVAGYREGSSRSPLQQEASFRPAPASRESNAAPS